jgi:hypothetical protein
MRLRSALVTAALVVLVADAALAQVPAPSPGGLRPANPVDALRDSTMRPLPTVPRAPAPPPGRDVWVPDRHVVVPGVPAPVHVPGHWERRVSEREVYTPPLVGVAPDGTTVHFPAGVRPAPEFRQSP